MKTLLIMLICFVLYGNVYAKESVSFVVMGDMPYTEKDKLTLQSLSTAIPLLYPQVLIHYGDLMSGGESCTERLLENRKSEIYDLLPGHVIYTPGDNEWADCDRKHLEKSFNELDRLNYLEAFFMEIEV